MSHRKFLTPLVVLAAFAVATTAYASSTPSSPNSFGGPGNPPVLKASCAREQMWITPAGTTWDGPKPNGKSFVFAVNNVFASQITCLVNRLRSTRSELFAVERCLTAAVPATAEAPADNQGYHDVQGLNTLRAYLKAQRDCVFTATGGAR
jgi:hypothetical protein